MATVNKDFKIKNGLVVEGSTGTINGNTILTEVDGDAYILSIAGGGGDSANTPNALVKRDANGDFAAGTVDVFRLNIGSVGYIEDDGSIEIVNTDGDDINITADDIRLKAADDVILSAGDQGSIDGDVVLTTSGGVIRLDAADVYVGSSEIDSARVATRDYVDTEISNIDLTFNTDEVTEGSTNLYFTNQRALDATSAAYDVAGAASDVQDNLDTHTNASSAHGVTGDIVGTTDTQTLSGKSISGPLNIQNENGTNTGYISAVDTTMYFNAGNGKDIQIAGQNIVLYGDGGSAYIGAATVENEIATVAYADSAASAAQTAAEGFATQAIADLVDSAPATLDTLNELAAALQDNPDIISDLQDIAAGKQDTLTAGNNIEIAGATISVKGLDTDDVSEGGNLYFTNQRALDATSAAYDVAGAASDVQDNLDTHTNASSAHGVTGDVVGTSDQQTLTNKTIDGSSNTISNIANASLVNDSITVNGSATALGGSVTLGTDDISEGANNLYYTNARAKAEAAALLTNATKTNIQITADGSNNLTITAENGVADSDTDDLTEGTTNLYFTDSRAVDALEAVVPNFTAVEVNSLAKQVAATVSAPTGGSAVTAYSFAKADYRSAKFLIKTAYGTHTELTEVLLTLDSSDNIAIVEYATVGTNGSSMTVTADVDGSNVRLRVTPTNNTSTVNVVGTLLA